MQDRVFEGEFKTFSQRENMLKQFRLSVSLPDAALKHFRAD
jgi:hypothetical protein